MNQLPNLISQSAPYAGVKYEVDARGLIVFQTFVILVVLITLYQQAKRANSK